MPPKKKPRLAEAPSEPETNNGQTSNTPASGESSGKPETEEYDIVADPWTDEQETALLKAIIRWKPVGMHKHFRMIAVSEFLKNQGSGPGSGSGSGSGPGSVSGAEHTRIPGIWKKLSTLYNLPGLDEREDSLIDVEDTDSSMEERYCPFELPEEYGEMMFARRLATEASESPVASRAESRGSNVADTDEARSSPAPSRGRKSTRGRQGRNTRTKRQAEAEESKKDTTATGEEDEGSDEDTGANDEAEEETSDVAKEDSDAEEEAEEDTTGPRSTRAKTSRSKQKDRGGGTGGRRTRRR